MTTRTSDGAYLSGLEERLGLGDFPGRLVGDLFVRVAVKHSEEVVVGTGHDGSIVAVPTALELVENAVVLVERAQFRAQIFVNLENGGLSINPKYIRKE